MHRKTHKDAARYFHADRGRRVRRRGFVIDLAGMEPQVAKPFSPDNVLRRVRGRRHGDPRRFHRRLHHDGRRARARRLILEKMLDDGHRRPCPTRNRLVVPGDLDIQARLREAGLLAAYERAGFRIGPARVQHVPGRGQRTRGGGRGLAHQPEPQLRKPHGQGLVRVARLGRHRRRVRAQLAVTDPRPCWLRSIRTVSAASSAAIRTSTSPRS
jgi:hypothetical protein